MPFDLTIGTERAQALQVRIIGPHLIYLTNHSSGFYSR